MKWNVFKYFADIVCADGKKRGAYAVTNILYFVLAALCLWGADALFAYNGEQMKSCTSGGMVLVSWFGLLACFAGVIEFSLLGVVSQIILLFCSILAMFDAEKRTSHILPLAVSSLSLIALVVAFCIFIL